MPETREPMSALAIEDELYDLDRLIGRRPRSPEKRIEWTEARVERLKMQVAGRETAVVVAQARQHKLRLWPFGQEKRANDVKIAQAKLREIKSQIAFEASRLERLKKRAEKLKIWEQTHAADLTRRTELRQERTTRIAKLGRAGVESLGQSMPGDQHRLGHAAWRSEIERERQERRRQHELDDSLNR